MLPIFLILPILHHSLCQVEVIDYHVGLLIDGAKFCSGSLIQENYVITAARCLHGAFEVDLVLGLENLLGRTKIAFIATSFIVHENATDDLLANDVALIKIPNIDASKYRVKFLQLPEDGVQDGTELQLSGYELTESDCLGELGKQEVRVTDGVCQDVSPCKSNEDIFFCVSANGKNKGLSGYRNRGSALVAEGDILVGIAVYNINNITCAMKVSHFRTWIQSKLAN